MDNLLHYMDGLNVSRSVCFATLPRFLGPEDEETNTWLHKELKGKDRLVGFGVIDFEKGDLRGQVNRISDFGFKGIKIHPALQHICVDGEKAFEVYEQAEKNGLFLTFHTGVHWSRVSDYGALTKLRIIFRSLHFRWSILAATAISTKRWLC